MRVETSEYQFSHGRKPRGFGLWFFELTTPKGKREFIYSGMYGKACEAAIAHGLTLQATRIQVGS